MIIGEQYNVPLVGMGLSGEGEIIGRLCFVMCKYQFILAMTVLTLMYLLPLQFWSFFTSYDGTSTAA